MTHDTRSHPPDENVREHPHRRRAAVAGTVLAVLAVIAGLLVSSASGATTASGSPVASTVDGSVVGTTANGLSEYLGIPFAAPPVGNLRWKPPAPVTPWKGNRSATQFGNECVQPSPTSTTTAVGSEDCLYLNVYTPAGSSGADLPVMFWIYGGAFFEGAGNEYDPSVLATREHVVVVTSNYRLGVFGFLGLPSLDAESSDHSSGNYGLQDQQAALRWVQSNIGNFGGNPRNVTIFGESAGAASVCYNVVSPTAAGLFAHAIAESGCGIPPITHSAATTTGAAFAKTAGCSTAATAASCLRGLSTATILSDTGGESLGATGISLTWAPNVSGRILPLSTQAAFNTGAFNKVPLLQGSNHDEGRLFVALGTFGNISTDADYQNVVTSYFGSAVAPAVLDEYPSSDYASPALALSAIVTDTAFSCPDYAINAPASAAVPTYTYEFDDPDAPVVFPVSPPFPLGAYHGSELAYIFQTVPSDPGASPGFTAAQQALSNTMQDYWAQFARTGDPNVAGAPAWSTFSSSTGQVQELTPTGIAPSSDFAAFHHCSFWSSLAGAS